MLRKILTGGGRDSGPAPAIDRCQGDEVLRQAGASALAGQFAPAEALLDSLDDWDDRQFALGYLATCGHGEDWCDRWHQAFPSSRQAPVVHGSRLVELAWNARGGGWTPNAGGFHAFQKLLDEASRAFDEAAERWPEDPSPWVGRIEVAIGRQEGLAAARGHLEQACRRAPLLIAAHERFLQASAAKWGGSEQAMMAHAASSAAHAPAGHPLHALPVFAIREVSLFRAVGGDAAGAAAAWASPEGIRLCDAAVRSYIRSASRSPQPDDARFAGITAYACTRLGRHDDALAAFEVCGPWVSEWVWGDGQRGVDAFAKARRAARSRAR